MHAFTDHVAVAQGVAHTVGCARPHTPAALAYAAATAAHHEADRAWTEALCDTFGRTRGFRARWSPLGTSTPQLAALCEAKRAACVSQSDAFDALLASDRT